MRYLLSRHSDLSLLVAHLNALGGVDRVSIEPEKVIEINIPDEYLNEPTFSIPQFNDGRTWGKKARRQNRSKK